MFKPAVTILSVGVVASCLISFASAISTSDIRGVRAICPASKDNFLRGDRSDNYILPFPALKPGTKLCWYDDEKREGGSINGKEVEWIEVSVVGKPWMAGYIYASASLSQVCPLPTGVTERKSDCVTDSKTAVLDIPIAGDACVNTRFFLSGRGRVHKGFDFRAGTGTPIIAPAAGTLTFEGMFSDAGNTIRIDHGPLWSGGPNVRTRYLHLKDRVKGPRKVKRGEKVAFSGGTGGVAPHLHFEVWVGGKPVDPTLYLKKWLPCCVTSKTCYWK